jgi:hypothetical protein
MSQAPPEPPDDGPEGQVSADDPAGPDADLDANDMDGGTPAEEPYPDVTDDPTSDTPPGRSDVPSEPTD